MTQDQFAAITEGYPRLRIGVAGDFCLDRYLEIDPAKAEVSIETGLPVHNVTHVRSQPGGAGTILNNLAALGVGEIYPLGFAGEDGEGMELTRALRQLPGVRADYFFSTPHRRTFTYCKPLLLHPNLPPEELNRFDSKNWTPTPAPVQEQLAQSFLAMAKKVHAIILLAQTDQPEAGVITSRFLEVVRDTSSQKPNLLILADSRTGLCHYPPVSFKMNRAELAAMAGAKRTPMDLAAVKETASELARRNGRLVVITLAEEGILGAIPDRLPVHVPAWPVRGAIDIVGAGDAVTANVTAALAAGASATEALGLANAAASIVIHQLGTTGTASVKQIRQLLFGDTSTGS